MFIRGFAGSVTTPYALRKICQRTCPEQRPPMAHCPPPRMRNQGGWPQSHRKAPRCGTLKKGHGKSENQQENHLFISIQAPFSIALRNY